MSESVLKMVCSVNIVYGNLNSENSQEFAMQETLTKLFVHEFGYRIQYVWYISYPPCLQTIPHVLYLVCTSLSQDVFKPYVPLFPDA